MALPPTIKLEFINSLKELKGINDPEMIELRTLIAMLEQDKLIIQEKEITSLEEAILANKKLGHFILTIIKDYYPQIEKDPGNQRLLDLCDFIRKDGIAMENELRKQMPSSRQFNAKTTNRDQVNEEEVKKSLSSSTKRKK